MRSLLNAVVAKSVWLALLVSLSALTLLQGCASGTPQELGRFGLCAEPAADLASQLDTIGRVWYYDYHYKASAPAIYPRLFMVRNLPFDRALADVMAGNRGAWWAVGNEPNDPNQDYRTPAEYAEFYHDFVQWAKRQDSQCRIIPAGFADADWRWANAFRESYQSLYGEYPAVDGWNIHDYILGRDPYDVDEFKRRIVAFRHWMLEIGESDKPLFLTEFGVLYGSGCCERPIDPPEKTVEFMRQSVQWLAETDYVQHWAWFILNNAREFNGGLFDASGHLTLYGETYRELARSYGP